MREQIPSRRREVGRNVRSFVGGCPARISVIRCRIVWSRPSRSRAAEEPQKQQPLLIRGLPQDPNPHVRQQSLQFPGRPTTVGGHGQQLLRAYGHLSQQQPVLLSQARRWSSDVVVPVAGSRSSPCISCAVVMTAPF